MRIQLWGKLHGGEWDSALLGTESRTRIAVTLALVLLVAVGFWLRVRHLGSLGLIVDEGIQALAVRGILEHGVPKADSGMIYSLGIPFTYIQAAMAYLWEADEFWLRFPGVLFGVAAIPAAYVLGKILFNRWVGLLTAVLMTISVWEVELARYARFYTAYQFTYIVALIFFYEGYIRDRARFKYWYFAAAVITFTFHSLGIMLATCFLIPMLSDSCSARRRWRFLFLAAAQCGLWLVYRKSSTWFRAMGDVPLYATDSGESLNTLEQIWWVIRARIAFTTTLALPDFGVLEHASRHSPMLLLGLALVAMTATVYLARHLYWRRDDWTALCGIAVVWAAFLQQFSTVFVLIALYLTLLATRKRDTPAAVSRLVLGVAALCLTVWLTFAVVHGARFRVIEALFGFPDLYGYFIYWYAWGWPIMTAVFIVGVVLLFLRLGREQDGVVSLFVLGAILFPIVIASVLPYGFYQSRYTFHLYPLILIVVAWTIMQFYSWVLRRVRVSRTWSRVLVGAVIALIVCSTVRDTNLVSAWSVGNRTYQSRRDPFRSVINWRSYGTFHQDYKTPSLYVRSHMAPGDRVVALGTPFMVSVYYFYVGQVDYVVSRPADSSIHLTKQDRTIVDYMTGSEVLTDLKQLVNTIAEESEGGIWILGDRFFLQACPESTREYLTSLAATPDYVGLDGQSFAERVR